MSKRQWVQAVVLMVLALGAVVALVLTRDSGLPKSVFTTPVFDNTPSMVQEDDPGWDCATMGNRVCGTPVPVVE